MKLASLVLFGLTTGHAAAADFDNIGNINGGNSGSNTVNINAGGGGNPETPAAPIKISNKIRNTNKSNSFSSSFSSQNQSARANNAGNMQAVSFTSPERIDNSSTYRVKNTPDLALGGPASGPCTGSSGGIGFSFPGFGGAANGAKVDPGCDARETARVAAMLGRMDVAEAILLNMPVVKAALEAKLPKAADSDECRRYDDEFIRRRLGCK